MDYPPIRRPIPEVSTAIPLCWQNSHAEHAQAFLKALRSGRWPIYLHGSIGVGKTCLAALAHASSIHNGRFYPASEFLRLLMTIRKEGKTVVGDSSYEVGERGFWNAWVDSPGLLCIDDIGIREPSPAQREAIFELVDRRGVKPTVYTSNLGAAELSELLGDDRIVSRMLRGFVLRLDGPDRRLTESTVEVARAS